MNHTPRFDRDQFKQTLTNLRDMQDRCGDGNDWSKALLTFDVMQSTIDDLLLACLDSLHFLSEEYPSASCVKGLEAAISKATQ